MKEQKENIDFGTVMSIDIRVCRVIEAVRVPKKDKLIQMTVNTGIDSRTSITNLGDKFEPEDFIGKKLAFVVNLEPSKIGGIMSEAMIFISETSGVPNLQNIDVEIGSTYL